MSDRITKVKVADLSVLHLHDTVDVDGTIGQIIRIGKPEPVPNYAGVLRRQIVLGPGTHPEHVYAQTHTEISILDATTDRKPVGHWGASS